jgi:hypothetical protein
MSWEFNQAQADLATRARVLAFLDALHGSGTLTFRDRDGGPRIVTFPIQARQPHDAIAHGRRLMDDLLLLQEWTGTPISLPDEIPGPAIEAIADAAEVIRRGESQMSFAEVTLEVSADQYPQFEEEPLDVEIGADYYFNLFDEVRPLGHLSGSMQARVARSEPVEGGPDGAVRVTLAPADEASAQPTFKLTRIEPE